MYVGADLATTPVAEALTTHGFDPSKPTLFTCEGILCYLPQVRLNTPSTASLPAVNCLNKPACQQACLQMSKDGTAARLKMCMESIPLACGAVMKLKIYMHSCNATMH